LAEGHVFLAFFLIPQADKKNGCPTIMVGAAVYVAGVSSFVDFVDHAAAGCGSA
jgi:hypothetical protein